MERCTFSEIREAMARHGYYVNKDHIHIDHQKFLYTITSVYTMPDPAELVATVNNFVESRRMWYPSRESAMMAGVAYHMHSVYLYNK